VRYGDHPDQVADVRVPAAGGEANLAQRWSLLLFLHGGFWRCAYDRAHTGPLATALTGTGFVVATPEYRRTGCPGGGWPGTFDDVSAAVRTLPRIIAERTEVDLASVVLAGHSAGGHLALWAAATCDVEGLRGVVALAPVADLRKAYRLDLDGGAVAALLGGAPENVADRYAAADPMALPPPRAPVTILHGSLDLQVPVDLSRRFEGAAIAAGAAVRLTVLPDIDHFDLIDPLSRAWSIVVQAIQASAQGSAGV
jgi:acetyl esterase/lipase